LLQIGGALIGPHALNIISDVHAVQHLAELGVVFLLFNIGLELSLERLQSMAKYVFGMGAAQVSCWCAVQCHALSGR
jgi:Kef-type K+ transport system membrane component KefB